MKGYVRFAIRGRGKGVAVRWGKSVALACAMVAAGVPAAHAQSTGGSIFGAAPAGATVVAKSAAGAHRHVTVKDSGRYTIGGLPLGVYTVILQKDDRDVDTRSNIPLKVGGGAEVDFACPEDRCAKAGS